MAATTFKRVTRERYWEMLEILPPAYQNGMGFLVGEAWTHRRCDVTGRDDTPAFQPFVEHRGSYYEGRGPMTLAEFRKLSPAEMVVG